jgi:hypothetical protein
MPRIELPSLQADTTPNWVEYRDRLMSLDRFEVQEVALVSVGDGVSRTSFLALQNDMRNALLGRIITAWSYPVPVPAQNNLQAADKVIGGAMDLDDYAALEDAIQPLMDKIAGRGNTPDPKAQADS